MNGSGCKKVKQTQLLVSMQQHQDPDTVSDDSKLIKSPLFKKL